MRFCTLSPWKSIIEVLNSQVYVKYTGYILKNVDIRQIYHFLFFDGFTNILKKCKYTLHLLFGIKDNMLYKLSCSCTYQIYTSLFLENSNICWVYCVVYTKYTLFSLLKLLIDYRSRLWENYFLDFLRNFSNRVWIKYRFVKFIIVRNFPYMHLLVLILLNMFFFKRTKRA